MWDTITDGLVEALAYSGVGIVLMGLGYLLVDIITPGKLRELIWEHRNVNATVLLTSNLLAVGLIVATAILASEDGLSAGIASTLVYGIAGLAMMAIAFLLLDLATPGKLGEMLVHPETHPAVWVSAAVHVAIGGILAAAIS